MKNPKSVESVLIRDIRVTILSSFCRGQSGRLPLLTLT